MLKNFPSAIIFKLFSCAKSSHPDTYCLDHLSLLLDGTVRAVIQKVSEASVSVDGNIVGRIGAGLGVLLGVGKNDNESNAGGLADKIKNLRIFEDEQGRMNRSLIDTGGALLAVSQFTLYGDCRKGNRPSFIDAAAPAQAERLYEYFSARLRNAGIEVANGRFQAHMQVALVNDGPVTLFLES